MTALHPVGDRDSHYRLSLRATDADQGRWSKGKCCRICGVDFKERLGNVLIQARGKGCARHRVPLIAHAARVQAEGIARRSPGYGAARGDRQHPGAGVLGEEPAFRKKAPALLACIDRPSSGRQGVIIDVSQTRDIEGAAKVARNAR